MLKQMASDHLGELFHMKAESELFGLMLAGTCVDSRAIDKCNITNDAAACTLKARRET